MYRLITDDDNNIKRPRNPRITANVFGIITYTWMLKLFKTGRSRDFVEKDLYSPLKDHTSSLLGNELEKCWRLELNSAYKMNRKPSLLRALLKGFGIKYMFYGLLLFFDGIILKLSQPLFIGGLLSYFTPHGSNKTDLRHAYVCAFGLLISMLTSMVLNHTIHLEILHYGMKMRIACCSIIFRKALCLSHAALGETTVGQVTNLLSNDVNRFDIALTYIHYLWIGPLQTIAVTYFMWREIGMSSIFGVATLIIFIPLQSWLGKQIFKFRLKTAIRTDERGRLMSEIIFGIRVIKMYTWEKLFVKLVEISRINEIRQIKGSSTIKAISTAFRGTQIRFQLFISILSYVLLGNNISIQKIFVVTSFYNILQGTMTVFFCNGVVQIAELLVTIKRIKNFLLLEEKNSILPKLSKYVHDVSIELNDYDENTLINNTDFENNTGCMNEFGIDIFNAFAKWTDVQTSYSLKNINLTARPGLLTSVIGPVGSGKSSLIHLILQELQLCKGRISVRGVVSYASQEPWLFAGSIRQNILFDSKMDSERYKQVLKVCALEDDLEQFPFGDKTIIGEKGVTLSGGQKARISLARAVYKQADIYLLDDPLSAVDSCVGKHLFEKCIKDYLREKTCLLITHQIQYLDNRDQIIILEDGHILAKGSYQELQAAVLNFEKLFESSDERIINPEYIDVIDKNCNNMYSKNFNECISSSFDKINAIEDETKQNEVAEVRSMGKISKQVYMSYFSAGGGPCNIFLFFFMYLFTQALTTGCDYWISFWVNQEEYVFLNKNRTYSLNDNGTMMTSSLNFYDTFIRSLDNRQTCIIVYAVLIISLIVVILLRSFIFVSFCTNASLNLHNRMFNVIIKATMHFFNTNSSGRILNRFSNDIGAVDEMLPSVLMDCLQMGMRFLGIIFVIGTVNIYLMLPTAIIGIILYYIRVFYLPTSRSFKRLEGVTRSPVLAHMNASIQGLTTIRAYKVEQTLSKEFDKHQDLHSSAWYLFISSNEAFGFWMDIVCLAYLSIVIFSFLIIGNNAYGGFVGLAITQTMALVGLVQWAIRQWAVFENQMTSVERIIDYSNSPQETDFDSTPDKTPPKEWPKSPKIVFQNLSLRYNPDSPYILKHLNFQIQPMEKIGIVGRTGAGKSSIIGALFRLALNEGKILIDDIEIHELGLHDLRSKISIIPQEAVLFSGTIRKNLDPFDEYSDHVLLNALDEVELKAVIEQLPEGLNSKIIESGFNFSVGQRQLLCLARAIVQNNNILILDEATANIDQQTDALIQNTIRNKFKTCTVLTIAHRLNTVIQSDRVIVLDAGKIVEFDHPYNLLKDKNGFLFSMVNQMGSLNADVLHRIASESFETMEMKRESLNNTNRNNIDYVSK